MSTYIPFSEYTVRGAHATARVLTVSGKHPSGVETVLTVESIAAYIHDVISEYTVMPAKVHFPAIGVEEDIVADIVGA